MIYPEIVMDTNKILAATLKAGRTRTILYRAPLTLITPPGVLEEAERHKKTLARKTGVYEETFMFLLQKLIRDRIVTSYPREPFVGRARAMKGQPLGSNPEAIALALEYGAPIWTNDAEMIKNSLKHRKYRALTRGVWRCSWRAGAGERWRSTSKRGMGDKRRVGVMVGSRMGGI